jgi:hypothetical protein
MGIVEPKSVECRTCDHFVKKDLIVPSEAAENQREFTCALIDPDFEDSCYVFDSMSSYCPKWVERRSEEEREKKDLRAVVCELIEENEKMRLELCNVKLQIDHCDDA